jgi:hypothetical protein
MAQQPNRGSINQADIMPATVTLVTGQYCKIGEVVCPAGLYKSIGFGASNSQSDAQGRMYVKLSTSAPAEITGKFRISIFSPQDRNMYTIFEAPSAALNQNVADRTKQIPMPETNYAIGKDYKFVFEFKPDTAGTITLANSVIQIDTTEQLLN